MKPGIQKYIHLGMGLCLGWVAGMKGAWAQSNCNSTDFNWTVMASMPTARDRLALGDVNGILYTVGGQNSSGDNLSTVEAYTPGTNSWSEAATLPTGREDLAVATVSGILYAIGGYNGTNVLSTVESYNPATNTWTPGLASMPTARCNLSAAVVGGVIYAVGGDDLNGNPLSTVESYNPGTNTWTPGLASMPTALSQFPMAAMNGIIYVSGGDPNTGYTTSLGVTNLTESYNPSANSWTTGLAPLPTPVETASGGTLNGLFYVAGGATNAFPGIENGVQAYNPSTNTWTVENPMLNIQAAAGGNMVNGSFYNVGGWNGSVFMDANQVGIPNCTPTPSYPGSNPPSPGDFFIYPSPARGSQASVSYNMSQSGQVDLRVWNEKAELVTQVTDSKPAGVQVTPFSIAGFGNGVYFYSLTLTYASGTVEKLGPKKFAIIH